LKTTKEDFKLAAKNKKELRLGKSTTYDVENQKDDQKKVIDKKDISEERDEIEKVRQQMEDEERKQLDAIKKWMSRELNRPN